MKDEDERKEKKRKEMNGMKKKRRKTCLAQTERERHACACPYVCNQVRVCVGRYLCRESVRVCESVSEWVRVCV